MFSLYFFDNGVRSSPDANEYDHVKLEANHASTARAFAKNLAGLSGRSVAVCREFGSRIAFIVTPEGAIQPPPGVTVSEREQCNRGGDAACFCSPCRAERRAARA